MKFCCRLFAQNLFKNSILFNQVTKNAKNLEMLKNKNLQRYLTPTYFETLHIFPCGDRNAWSAFFNILFQKNIWLRNNKLTLEMSPSPINSFLVFKFQYNCLYNALFYIHFLSKAFYAVNPPPFQQQKSKLKLSMK